MNTPKRDLLEEAQYWREHIRKESPLVEVLAELPDQHLIECYKLWWAVYSGRICTARSNRNGQGVAELDARAAGVAANDAVIARLGQVRVPLLLLPSPPRRHPMPDKVADYVVTPCRHCHNAGDVPPRVLQNVDE